MVDPPRVRKREQDSLLTLNVTMLLRSKSGCCHFVAQKDFACCHLSGRFVVTVLPVTHLLKQGLGETPDAKQVRNKVSNSRQGVSGETEGQKKRETAATEAR